MEKTTVTVINPLGLHARPASMLANLVKGFQCEIKLYRNGDESKQYQPKSIISIMSLGAAKGDILTFEANGEDEKEAIKAIEEFVSCGCGE